MKKKSIAIRLGVVAMALTMVTTSLSSGTLAKFTQTVDGYTGFSVARWNVNATITKTAGGTDKWTATAQSATINAENLLTQTIDTTKTNDGDGKNLAAGVIAPGTHGKFYINLSDATALATGSDDRTQVKTNYTVYIRRVDKNNVAAPANFTMTKVAEEAYNETANTTVILIGNEDADQEYSYETNRGAAFYDKDGLLTDMTPYFDTNGGKYVYDLGLPLCSGSFDPDMSSLDQHKRNIEVLWDWDYAPKQESGESDEAYAARVVKYDALDYAATDSSKTLKQIQFVVTIVFTQDSAIEVTAAGT